MTSTQYDDSMKFISVCQETAVKAALRQQSANLEFFALCIELHNYYIILCAVVNKI